MANIFVQGRRPASVFDEMDRIMDSMFDNSHGFSRIGSLSNRNPAVDVLETPQDYSLEAELPGLEQNQVEIKVEDGVLHISSIESETTQKVETENEPKYLVRERRNKVFSRSFVLPKDVDAEKISAKFANGLLVLTLPKLEKAQPRKIAIHKA